MPTRKSQGMLGLLRSHKKFVTTVGNDWIMRVNPPADVVAKLHMQGTTAQTVPSLHMPALMVEPHPLDNKDAVILHMHGGAYVSGGILQCRSLISPICAAAGVRALTFCYRLAPQYPYPAQLEDAYRAYRYLRDQGFAAEKIAFVGESAGGNLALALALRLRDEGEKLPCAIALLSPWLDLAQRGDSYKTLQRVDATLDGEELLQCAIRFSGGEDKLTDPRISPVYADFTGFPPVQIHCGTNEILLSDSEQLELALLRRGVKAQLLRWVGMCHVFQAFGFEESRASNRQIGMFLKKHLAG